MKTTYNFLHKSLLVTVLFVATVSFASALPSNQGKELAFNFNFFNFLEGETVGDSTSSANTGVVVPETTPESEVIALATSSNKNSCEHFDSTTNNILTLENASAEARQKIENVEETLDTESSLRDSIFDSVKNLIGLQKKDKVIFREMKKDLGDAKTYYDNLDGKISEVNLFLNENACEDTKMDTAEKIDNDTSDMVIDESTFRKQFVGSLKEKMKILQNSVKEAKK